MLPWTDRAGRLSPLKIAALVGALMPLSLLIGDAWQNALGPRPIVEATHRTGDWAIRFLWLSLLVTPLRRAFDWPKLIVVRRHLGLAALGYALLHFALYTVDLQGNVWKIATEIVLRVYLLIGFVALLSLVALGATSFDRAIKAMGAARWNRLHLLAYPASVLAVVHFALQVKADVSEPMMMAGLLVALFGTRAMHRRGVDLDGARLALLGLVASGATALMEAAWYYGAKRIDPIMVLSANISADLAPRPAHLVLAIVLAVAGAAVLARLRPGRRARTGRLAPAAE